MATLTLAIKSPTCTTFAKTPKSPCRIIEQQLLVFWDDLPTWLRDNQYLHTGFRPASSSYIKSIASLSYIHNQTGNIYSHLLAGVGMLFAANFFVQYVQEHYPSASTQDLVVLGAFVSGMEICYFLSAAFHTFANHSDAVQTFWLQLDLLGIVAVMTGAFVPGLWYTFYCGSIRTRVNWIAAELNAQTLAAIIVLFVPRFRAPEWSTIRAFFFVFMGSSAFYPIIYATYLYGFERMNHEAGASFYLLAALLYLAGAVIYALRWPEKQWPGQFDIWGHSHQIFHSLVILGLVAHLAAFLQAFDFHHRLGQCRN